MQCNNYITAIQELSAYWVQRILYQGHITGLYVMAFISIRVVSNWRIEVIPRVQFWSLMPWLNLACRMGHMTGPMGHELPRMEWDYILKAKKRLPGGISTLWLYWLKCGDVGSMCSESHLMDLMLYCAGHWMCHHASSRIIGYFR